MALTRITEDSAYLIRQNGAADWGSIEDKESRRWHIEDVSSADGAADGLLIDVWAIESLVIDHYEGWDVNNTFEVLGGVYRAGDMTDPTIAKCTQIVSKNADGFTRVLEPGDDLDFIIIRRTAADQAASMVVKASYPIRR